MSAVWRATLFHTVLSTTITDLIRVHLIVIADRQEVGEQTMEAVLHKIMKVDRIITTTMDSLLFRVRADA
jgi:hypothetical protein